jgi:hypothetical protein
MKTPIKIVAALAAIMLATGPPLFGDGFRVGGYLPGYAAKQLDFTAIRGIDELFLLAAWPGRHRSALPARGHPRGSGGRQRGRISGVTGVDGSTGQAIAGPRSHSRM